MAKHELMTQKSQEGADQATLERANNLFLKMSGLCQGKADSFHLIGCLVQIRDSCETKLCENVSEGMAKVSHKGLMLSTRTSRVKSAIRGKYSTSVTWRVFYGLYKT